MATKAFDFTKEKWNETKDIYCGILSQLGVKNPEAYIQRKIEAIPPEKRNGLMFNSMVEELFYAPEDKFILGLSGAEKKQYADKIAEADKRRQAVSSKILKNILNDKSVSPYIVGYFGEMAGEYIPFDTVLTSGTMVGEGKSLQMGCGEGKTGVLSLAAFAKLRNNENTQVFLTSSTAILASEAMDKIEFYDRVGMADKVALISTESVTFPQVDDNGKLMYASVINEDGTESLFPAMTTHYFRSMTEEQKRDILQKAYTYPLVSSDNATLMQHAMEGYLSEPTGDINRELLADEADFVLLDSYRPMQMTKKKTERDSYPPDALRGNAYAILKKIMAENPNIYNMDDANQYVDFTKEGREAVVREIMGKFGNVHSVDTNQLFDYVYDALQVETVYKENRDYQVINDGHMIVSEDRASGVAIELPEGIKQALEVKLRAEQKYFEPVSEEKQVVDTLNVQSFFKEYFNGIKHFVSGTLGIDSEEILQELADNFDVNARTGDVYEASPKGEGKRIDQGKTMFKTQDEKQQAIVDNALENIKAGRPVLVGAVSEKELFALQEKLKASGYEGRTLIYTAASEKLFGIDKVDLRDEQFKAKYGVDKKAYQDYASLIKNESGKEGTITLGTSIIGRGTTIKTSDEIDDNGGIHVIIDGLHETSSRNQEQYKARTARGTNAGSTIEFFSVEDIPEAYRDGMEEMIDQPDEVYKQVYQKIDARTASIRAYVVEFVEQTRDHAKFIDSMPMLNSEQKEQAKALLLARAFSIKNRACGVSQDFSENIEEYKKEIDMYTKMYVAETRAGKDFNEAEWMKANGYEDMVASHMPFSEQRKEQIFTLAGIKAHVENSREGKVEEALKASKEAVQEVTKGPVQKEDIGVAK